MRLAECMQTFHHLWFFFMSCCCSFHQGNKPRYLFAFEENNQWDKTKLLPQGTGSRSTKENYCTSFELTAPTASLTCHTGTITTVLTLLDTITLRDRNLCTSPCTHVHVALDHQGSSLKHVCVFLYFPSHTAKSLQTFFCCAWCQRKKAQCKKKISHIQNFGIYHLVVTMSEIQTLTIFYID